MLDAPVLCSADARLSTQVDEIVRSSPLYDVPHSLRRFGALKANQPTLQNNFLF